MILKISSNPGPSMVLINLMPAKEKFTRNHCWQDLCLVPGPHTIMEQWTPTNESSSKHLKVQSGYTCLCKQLYTLAWNCWEDQAIRIYLYLLAYNYYSWKMARCQRNTGKNTWIVSVLHHSISDTGTQRPVIRANAMPILRDIPGF